MKICNLFFNKISVHHHAPPSAKIAARGCGFFALLLILNLTPLICQAQIFVNKDARIFGTEHIYVGIFCNTKAPCAFEIPDCNRQIGITTAKYTKVARHAFHAMGQIRFRSYATNLCAFVPTNTQQKKNYTVIKSCNATTRIRELKADAHRTRTVLRAQYTNAHAFYSGNLPPPTLSEL